MTLHKESKGCMDGQLHFQSYACASDVPSTTITSEDQDHHGRTSSALLCRLHVRIEPTQVGEKKKQHREMIKALMMIMMENANITVRDRDKLNQAVRSKRQSFFSQKDKMFLI